VVIMYRHLCISPTRVRFERWVFVVFIFILLLTSCQLGTLDLPPRDCRARANVPVRGRVLDWVTRQPMVGAEILVRSTKPTSRCPDYGPIPNLKLTTDNQGRFNGVIPVMHLADNAEVIVSALGYKTRHLDVLMDDMFITLDRQPTPTPGI